MRMRLWCMMFYFINFVDENDVFWRRIHLPQMLSGQQMNLEVLLMWTSLRSTLSSFFKHMCMRFSTTTPTETSFCRAAFYFWKL